MEKYFAEFLEEFSYEEEDKAALQEAFDQIAGAVDVYKEFTELLKIYEEDVNCDFNTIRGKMKEIASQAGIHEYTGNLILFICLSKFLKQYYVEAGLNEGIWFTTMSDLKWKMVECKEVYGIRGTFVPEWYDRFFKLERFGFGKLQFELIPFEREYQRNGISLKPDSVVINVHIPRTGTRLERESMIASYRTAAEFFKDNFKENPIVFVCRSWLLYPRNKEVLSEKSNLYAFMSDYDVFEQDEYPDYSQAWRLFDVQYDGDVDHLPQNTSLRRAYAEWIRRGEKLGWGYGVFIYNI